MPSRIQKSPAEIERQVINFINKREFDENEKLLYCHSEERQRRRIF